MSTAQDVIEIAEQDLPRLLQWQNLFGPTLEQCQQGADRYPVLYELLAQEVALEPLAEWARLIRDAMTQLEPAEFCYWAKVQTIVNAIGCDGQPTPLLQQGNIVFPAPGWSDRKEYLQQQTELLQQWFQRGACGDDTINRLLGKADRAKRWLVGLVLEKLSRGEVPADRMAELLQDPALNAFEHRIAMLDPLLWSFPENLHLLLTNIGQGFVTGEWHQPGGPLAWADGAPHDFARVKEAVAALGAWLDDEPATHPFISALGQPDAYAEKRWLGNCLLILLQYHASRYFRLAAVPVEAVLPAALRAFADHQDQQYRTYRFSRSYLDMRVVAMRSAGWQEVDYETLMVVSGFAAGFAWHPTHPWVAGLLPPEADLHLEQATGFGWEWLLCDDVETYWRHLRESIDSGRPVHAFGTDDMLFVGYSDAPDDQERRVRPLAIGNPDRDLWWKWDEFVAWFTQYSRGQLGRHTRDALPGDPQRLAAQILADIVTSSLADPRQAYEDLPEGLLFGLAALDDFAAAMENLELSGEPGVYFAPEWLGGHAIYTQIGGRRCLAQYLRKLLHAGLFVGAAHQAVQTAAQRYDAATAAWREWETHLGRPDLAPPSAWLTPRCRKAGAASARQAIAHERAALEALETVLQLIA